MVSVFNRTLVFFVAVEKLVVGFQSMKILVCLLIFLGGVYWSFCSFFWGDGEQVGWGSGGDLLATRGHQPCSDHQTFLHDPIKSWQDVRSRSLLSVSILSWCSLAVETQLEFIVEVLLEMGAYGFRPQ